MTLPGLVQFLLSPPGHMGDRGKVHFELARVFRAQRGWLVRIPVEDGSTLEYRYATRRAARYFAAVFRLRPTWFPPAHAVVSPPSRAEETLDLGAPEFLAAVDAAFSEAF